MAFTVQETDGDVTGADDTSPGIVFLGPEPVPFLSGDFTDYTVTGETGSHQLVDPNGQTVAYEAEPDFATTSPSDNLVAVIQGFVDGDPSPLVDVLTALGVVFAS